MTNCYSREELNGKCLFLPDNVQEGFGTGCSITVSGQEENLSNFLLALCEKASAKYADFYYAELKSEDQERFRLSLTDFQRNCFDRLLHTPGKLFYPLDTDNFQFFFSITVSELLFSTFYFGDPAITIWGNYNCEFPVFFLDQEALKHTTQLALNCGLTVR